MPNCHFDVAIISRGAGRSAVATSAYDSGSKLSSTVASAAYRSGEVLFDSRAGKIFDYRHKDDVLHVEIFAPASAPTWVFDRECLWNVVETEKRKDAQLARSIIAALPRELTAEQNIALTQEFVHKNFVAAGMIADVAIHDKDASDGGRNPHVHIMLTMREITPEGFAAKKNRDWNHPGLVSVWRNSWEAITNQHLAAAGSSERVSLKSYKEQGIDKIPQQHMGYKADKLERRKKVETQVGNQNRQIRQQNAVKDILRSRNPEPYTPEAVEGWYQSVWERAKHLIEWNISSVRARKEQTAEEEQGRVLVASAEKAVWFGLGGRTRASLYYQGPGSQPMPDQEALARHQAVLHSVLRDTSGGSPIWLAESVNRVQAHLQEQVERSREHIQDSSRWYGHYAAPPQEPAQPERGQER